MGLFDWVGISKNAGKTVGMVFCPCKSEVTQLEAVCERRMMGIGLSYW